MRALRDAVAAFLGDMRRAGAPGCAWAVSYGVLDALRNERRVLFFLAASTLIYAVAGWQWEPIANSAAAWAIACSLNEVPTTLREYVAEHVKSPSAP